MRKWGQCAKLAKTQQIFLDQQTTAPRSNSRTHSQSNHHEPMRANRKATRKQDDGGVKPCPGPAPVVHYCTCDEFGSLLTYETSTYDDEGRITSQTSWVYQRWDTGPGGSAASEPPATPISEDGTELPPIANP